MSAPISSGQGLEAVFRQAVESAERSHTGMSYGDEKHGDVTGYTKGWGDCLAVFKALLTREPKSDECSHLVKWVDVCEQCKARAAADRASLLGGAS